MMIPCVTLDGHTRLVRQDSLVLRPAVYALVVYEGQVLLMRMRHSGKYHPHFYYVCRPRTLKLVDDAQVDDDAAEKPRWVDILGLQTWEFRIYGDTLLKVCREAAAG